MKSFLKLLIVPLLLLAALPFESKAGDATFAGPGTAISTNLSYYVAPASGVGIPVVTYLNTTTDNTASKVTFYSADVVPVELTAAAVSGTNKVAAVGTSFAASDVVVIRYVASDTYQRLTVASSTATTVTFSQNLSRAAAIGDELYEVTAHGTIPLGDATKEISHAKGFYSGREGQPLLLEVNGIGTNTVKINVVSGYFQRQ